MTVSITRDRNGDTIIEATGADLKEKGGKVPIPHDGDWSYRNRFRRTMSRGEAIEDLLKFGESDRGRFWTQRPKWTWEVEDGQGGWRFESEVDPGDIKDIVGDYDKVQVSLPVWRVYDANTGKLYGCYRVDDQQDAIDRAREANPHIPDPDSLTADQATW